MKLFLFKPSETWTFAGGCIGIVAKSFEHAVETAEKDSRIADDVSAWRCDWICNGTVTAKLFFETQAEVYEYLPDLDWPYPRSRGAWVLDQEFWLDTEHADAGIVFWNFYSE